MRAIVGHENALITCDPDVTKRLMPVNRCNACHRRAL